MDTRKKDEFTSHFKSFLKEFASSPPGRRHADLLPRTRASGRQGWERTLEARGTPAAVDLALLKLFPHPDSTRNLEQGAWVHVQPTLRGEARTALQNNARSDALDWDELTTLLIDFIERCVTQPERFESSCRSLAASPIARCLTSDLLSPILNALSPDAFPIINASTRDVVGHLLNDRLRNTLRAYPEVQAAHREALASLGDVLAPEQLSDVRPDDLFGMFCWWRVELRGEPLQSPRAWRIALGEDPRGWDAWRDEGFVAMGWEELGDLSLLDHDEFVARRTDLLEDVTTASRQKELEQVWRFRSQIHEGDRVVANYGDANILGIGTVVGNYYYRPDTTWGHRIPVRWDDLTARSIPGKSWKQPLARLTQPRFERIQSAEPAALPDTQPGSGRHLEFPFTEHSFDLLDALHDEPTKQIYLAHKESFRRHIEWPFQQVFLKIGELLPVPIQEVMETTEGLFGRILKNDFGRGGAWDHYWGAFYPRGSKRIASAQLYMRIDHEALEFGFDIGEYAESIQARFVDNCQRHQALLGQLLEGVFHDKQLTWGARTAPEGSGDSRPTWHEWLADPEQHGVRVAVEIPRGEAVRLGTDPMIRAILDLYERLFVLVLLAVDDDPLLAISEHLGEATLTEEAEEEAEPRKPLSEIAHITGLSAEQLSRWVDAIERKGQAIIYGPPGTGKTYLAELLAQQLVDGGSGFAELVQFHPAYSYEDFIQGIRPSVGTDGVLKYAMVPGRLLRFCEKAAARDGRCVLIIDEINRADLSRVFGELMYLLEYRDREIPLAGGGPFRIPGNVRLIGTMNTADRSIALVDYALRRRFVFLNLRPNYEVLRRYHANTGFFVGGLIATLKALNQAIGDRHYEVGISFFLRQRLQDELEDVWRMEIEPYLEEFFFDQPDKLERFRWESVASQILIA